jgi:hypothetical protein
MQPLYNLYLTYISPHAQPTPQSMNKIYTWCAHSIHIMYTPYREICAAVTKYLIVSSGGKRQPQVLRGCVPLAHSPPCEMRHTHAVCILQQGVPISTHSALKPYVCGRHLTGRRSLIPLPPCTIRHSSKLTFLSSKLTFLSSKLTFLSSICIQSVLLQGDTRKYSLTTPSQRETPYIQCAPYVYSGHLIGNARALARSQTHRAEVTAGQHDHADGNHHPTIIIMQNIRGLLSGVVQTCWQPAHPAAPPQCPGTPASGHVQLHTHTPPYKSHRISAVGIVQGGVST